MPQYTIRPATMDFLEVLEKEAAKKKKLEDVHMIQVDEVVSTLTFLYEKIRNIIDYKDDHLLRKNAIKRILVRRFVINPKKLDIAEPLLRELIHSRYLPNNAVPESEINKVQKIIDKYFVVLNNLEKGIVKKPNERINWLLGLAAAEIEAYLVPANRQNALVRFVYESIHRNILFTKTNIDKPTQKIQLIIAIKRLLTKSDHDMIHFALARHFYPDWFKKRVSADEVRWVTKNLKEVRKKVEKQEGYVVGKRLKPIVKKYLPPFFIIQDIFENDPNESPSLFYYPDDLSNNVRKTYRKLYQSRRTKLRQKGVRAMVYLFITKMTLALVLELPYEYFILQKVNYVALGINLLFPPILMLLFAVTTWPARKQDVEMMALAVKEVVYEGEREIFRGLKRVSGKSSAPIKAFFYTITYLATFVFSFGVIISILSRLEFNVLNMALFIFFVSLVTFFGITLRQSAKELLIIRRRENLLILIIHFFTLPIIQLGKWLSVNIAKINVFVFILDFLIEAPFKVVIQLIEDAVGYLKEKKEEIY